MSRSSSLDPSGTQIWTPNPNIGLRLKKNSTFIVNLLASNSNQRYKLKVNAKINKVSTPTTFK